MRGPWVDSMRCSNCGTENHEAVGFCVYCGTPLLERSEEPVGAVEAGAGPAPPSAVKPTPPSAREHHPDFVGLIGLAFFLLVVGIVFTVNTGLLNDLRAWWNQIIAGGLLLRPPEGIIASGVLFFALIGLSNFLTAGLRWILDRSRFGALARVLAGSGFFALAFLLTRYASRNASGQLVISAWTAVLGALLIIYIAVGLYWVRARRPEPAGVQASR